MRTEIFLTVSVEPIGAAAVDDAGCHVVGQAEFDDLFELFLYTGIVYGSIHFHPMIQVAGHPVGRTDVIVFAPAASENQNAGMFQIAVDDAADFDIFAQIFDAGDDRTVPPYQKPHLDAGLRGFVEFFDDLFIGDVVDFGQNIGFFSLSGPTNFFVDQRHDLSAHVLRSHQQMTE